MTAETTGSGTRYILRLKQNPVKLKHRIPEKCTEAAAMVLRPCDDSGATAEASIIEIRLQNLLAATWIIASSSWSCFTSGCLQCRYGSRSRIFKRVKPFVLPPVSSWKCRSPTVFFKESNHMQAAKICVQLKNSQLVSCSIYSIMFLTQFFFRTLNTSRKNNSRSSGTQYCTEWIWLLF